MTEDTQTEKTVRGKARRFGDDIDTDIIIPGQYMRGYAPEEYAKHAMEPIDPDFYDRIDKGDIMVAENNFGIGSSREHAPIALKYAGIGAIIAVNFARIFYRNAINQGLPLLKLDLEQIKRIDEEDELEVDITEGIVRNLTTGEEYRVSDPLGELEFEILKAGGAINYYKQKTADKA